MRDKDDEGIHFKMALTRPVTRITVNLSLAGKMDDNILRLNKCLMHVMHVFKYRRLMFPCASQIAYNPIFISNERIGHISACIQIIYRSALLSEAGCKRSYYSYRAFSTLTRPISILIVHKCIICIDIFDSHVDNLTQN